MKNVFKTCLLVSLFALFTVSCVEEHYTSSTDVWIFAKEYEVGTPQRPWIKEGPGLFFCDITINELSHDVYNNGILMAYFVYKVGNTLVDSPLPFDDFFMDKDGYRYTYQYTCEFSPRRVTFTFKDNSFFEQEPGRCTFVVKLMR